MNLNEEKEFVFKGTFWTSLFIILKYQIFKNTIYKAILNTFASRKGLSRFDTDLNNIKPLFHYPVEAEDSVENNI